MSLDKIFETQIKKMHAILRGTPEVMMQQYLQEATRKVCEESRCWQKTFDPIDIVAGQTDYYLTPYESAEIHALTDVAVEGNTLQSDDFDVIDTYIFRFAVAPESAITGGLEIKAVLVPCEDTDDYPDWIISRYSSAIRFHALYEILVMPGQPWSNQKLSEHFEKKYMHSMLKAVADAYGGIKDLSPTMKPRRFI